MPFMRACSMSFFKVDLVQIRHDKFHFGGVLVEFSLKFLRIEFFRVLFVDFLEFIKSLIEFDSDTIDIFEVRGFFFNEFHKTALYRKEGYVLVYEVFRNMFIRFFFIVYLFQEIHLFLKFWIDAEGRCIPWLWFFLRCCGMSFRVGGHDSLD